MNTGPRQGRMMERKIPILVDPRTGEKIYTSSEQMRRQIIKAVIRGNRINDGAPPFPIFRDQASQKSFLDHTAELIAEFMTDRQTFDDLMAEIKEDVQYDKNKRIREFENAGFPRNLLRKELDKIENCLNMKMNRLPEPLNGLCNPNTEGWRKDENILISKLLAVYRKFSPLKTSRRIYENMAIIFIACGLRSEMTISDCSKLVETLRKRRIKAAATF